MRTAGHGGQCNCNLQLKLSGAVVDPALQQRAELDVNVGPQKHAGNEHEQRDEVGRERHVGGVEDVLEEGHVEGREEEGHFGSKAPPDEAVGER